MEPMRFRGKWILVTGASSGLGWEMSLQLAREHGANLIPVARRADRLEELKKRVASTGVEVDPVAADLSSVEEVDRVIAHATRDGRQVYGAILNAGVTHFGHYHELKWEQFEQMLATNVTGVVRMTLQLMPHFKAQSDRGGVMLVSSMAGLTPVAYQSVYSATKAFLVHFGCSLAHEVERDGIAVTTFAPGGIATEMTSSERFRPLQSWLMPAERCAREALTAFSERRHLYVPGLLNRVGATLLGVLPKRFAGARLAATYRSALEATAATAATAAADRLPRS